MSVTFWCPDAPRRQIPCKSCLAAGERCDPYCLGFTVESEAPEVNFANGNAAAILELLGYCSAPGGEVPDTAVFRRRIVRARNIDRSHLEHEGYELPGGHGVAVVRDEDGIDRIQPMGCRVVSFGNTDEQTLRRLEALDRLAAFAQEHKLEIVWG